MIDCLLKAVDAALRERQRAFDEHGADSFEYAVASGRLIASKEALRDFREGCVGKTTDD